MIDRYLKAINLDVSVIQENNQEPFLKVYLEIILDKMVKAGISIEERKEIDKSSILFLKRNKSESFLLLYEIDMDFIYFKTFPSPFVTIGLEKDILEILNECIKNEFQMREIIFYYKLWFKLKHYKEICLEALRWKIRPLMSVTQYIYELNVPSQEIPKELINYIEINKKSEGELLDLLKQNDSRYNEIIKERIAIIGKLLGNESFLDYYTNCYESYLQIGKIIAGKKKKNNYFNEITMLLSRISASNIPINPEEFSLKGIINRHC